MTRDFFAEMFDHYAPYSIGFDRVFNRLNNYTTESSYPPYNIIKNGDFDFTIELAIAGFCKKDIDIELSDGVLTIKSIKENNDNENNLYRGISYRKFTRRFTLSDDIVVNSAKLENGLLKVHLERIVPEEKKPKKISIEG